MLPIGDPHRHCLEILADLVRHRSVELVLGDERSRTKDAVMERLSESLITRDQTLASHRLLECLRERESLQSTGLGDGVAIPHAGLGGFQGQVGALLIIPDGVDFDAVDKRPVHIVFGIAFDRARIGEHLRTLASLSRWLSRPTFRSRLTGAADRSSLLAVIEEDARLRERSSSSSSMAAVKPTRPTLSPAPPSMIISGDES
jgi:nitrogen PTS system EIIA component